MDFNGSAAEIFVIEAKELLAKMEEILLKMEQGEQNSDFINNIFRSAHTLKGAAAMFDFTELSSFAHEIENLLSSFRENKVAISQNKIAVLLESVDCLTSLMEESIKFKVNQQTIDRKIALIKKMQTNDESATNQIVPTTSNAASNLDVAPMNTHSIKNLIKIDAGKLDEIINLIGEVVIAQAHLNNIIKDNKTMPDALSNTAERIGNLIDDLRNLSLQLRMMPIKEIFSKFSRVVRDIAIQKNKQIKLQIEGSDTELDKAIIEKINDPLLHLIRNACDHGIDLPADRVGLGKPICGLITLNAKQENNEIIIKTSDDGRGIDLDKVKEKAIKIGLIKKDANLSEQEILACIFEPGFSTSDEITDLSGRGVGMDVVRKEVEKLHGSIQIDSRKMLGTTISIRLPLTLAIINGLLVKISNFSCVIPMWNVIECIEITPEEYHSIVYNSHINFRNKILPSIILSQLFEINNQRIPNTAIIVQYADYKIGIIVDALDGEIQTVIKPMPEILATLRWVNGTAILGNGDVAMILDMPGLIADAIDQHQNKVTA